MPVPIARNPEDVRRRAAELSVGLTGSGPAPAGRLEQLDSEIVACRACPRLVAWREQVAAEKRRSFAAETYWGKPIPGWGDAEPRVLIVGLAPAAHGGNRTGRIFTGDRSGDWLFASLYRVGLAVLPTSVSADDGQALVGTRMVAAVRCAPPDNKPTVEERDTCAPWLDTELAAVLPNLRVAVALGGFAWLALLAALARIGEPVPRPRPRFSHGAELQIGDLAVLASFHPSQQNTFTGRLTEPMLDQVLGRAAGVAGLGPTL
jgi:uracil-DNA glycosylase family 4